MDWLFKGYLFGLVVVSVVTFAAFGIDKRRAAAGGNRISERTLHLMALFGGWPGALVGQRFFRHKTIKLSFRMTLWLIVAMHMGIIWCFGVNF